MKLKKCKLKKVRRKFFSLWKSLMTKILFAETKTNFILLRTHVRLNRDKSCIIHCCFHATAAIKRFLKNTYIFAKIFFMSLLVVGTVAFDAIETPFGKTDKIIGGAEIGRAHV